MVAGRVRFLMATYQVYRRTAMGVYKVGITNQVNPGRYMVEVYRSQNG